MTEKKKSHCEKPPSPCCERETRESECECVERPPVGYVTERNRFFTGKFMTARDFRAEQEYFLRRRWLQNRLFHGWGIACGLHVRSHEDPRCKGWVKVQRGIAIDCYGREIILDCERSVKIPCWKEPPREPCEKKSPPKCDDESGGPEQRPPEDPRQEPKKYLVCIRYCEVEAEKVPALFADGACDPVVEEANRIREKPVIEILPLSDFTPQCWGHDDCKPHHHGHEIDWQNGPEKPKAPGKCHDEKNDTPECAPCEETAANRCVDPCAPFCPCGLWVPLALLVVKPGEKPGIEHGGRRELMQATTCLTKIVKTNWTHGGTVDPRKQDELRICFSQPVQPSSGPGDGVNRHTFTLRRRRVGYNMEDVDLPAGLEPRLEDGNRVAVFPLRKLLDAHMDKFFGAYVYIRLRCDFILDESSHAVDGDFLGGKLPTGNDHPGGTFESWVRIPDRGEVQK